MLFKKHNGNDKIDLRKRMEKEKNNERKMYEYITRRKRKNANAIKQDKIRKKRRQRCSDCIK